MAALKNKVCEIAFSTVVSAVVGLFILSFLIVFTSERFVGVKKVSEEITPSGVVCAGACIARSACQERGGVEMERQMEGCSQVSINPVPTNPNLNRNTYSGGADPKVCCLI